MEGYFLILIIIAIVAYQVTRPSHCDICGNKFLRVYHTWNIGGVKKHLCPHCNSQMRRKNSASHF